MIPRKQIGFNQEENLLWEISKQLDKTITTLRTTGTVITTTTIAPTTTTTSSSTTTTTTTVNPCINCVQTTVTIDTQVWDRCNLTVDRYRNGDIIPQVTDPTAWAGLTTGAWCYYNNDPSTEAAYGKLYNFYAVVDPRGLAPLNKSIPTDAEYTILTNFLGGEAVAGGKMKAQCNWVTPNVGATNSSGFTAFGGGFRNGLGGFSNLGANGYWWSSTEVNLTIAWLRNLNFGSIPIVRGGNEKKLGLSVRCLND
jgi:uncharacterized protein (TIGR02145 family)